MPLCSASQKRWAFPSSTALSTMLAMPTAEGMRSVALSSSERSNMVTRSPVANQGVPDYRAQSELEDRLFDDLVNHDLEHGRTTCGSKPLRGLLSAWPTTSFVWTRSTTVTELSSWAKIWIAQQFSRNWRALRWRFTNFCCKSGKKLNWIVVFATVKLSRILKQ